ncbi:MULTISPECIES: winged helix-turn-helix domain-containing tetratricopeptide repeat protein [Bradyrhizobium]|uniref:winged helix-turn-helix domain-containing tetratricopeptide repeat protein n=1 Tax=Bradyrhizobium TaxID=374 RepID=UPI00155F0B4E|nr:MULTISPECIES: winged helix-turn-helix domain-containing protein [Bradyrhizobium]MDD1520006.1 adenylate cyclase 3 [Bradyrhizobium sp. WBAH30]MDD1544250.1 adenylate cyclase 3 [Bradyrhizobium sp. WBAH41]MDD1558132.1 adenylate cyclase 3 [Bradyrhizobium sp. WBAH23]MDD1565530.1 adenylate cyclase 3 [Bradyrhizobium sp. WBAH33]MDD1590660.1 adenylate cyclase 3 [Bradyrhizobium sp. WBAH42]
MRYLFEDYALDVERRELNRGVDHVSATPQVFDLLLYLIRNRERVVSKDDLINAVWKGRIVSDAALTTRLNAVRAAIGDTGEEQHRLIKTFPRKGFRFVGAVREDVSKNTTTSIDPVEPDNLQFPLPDKPSIAVLPFENMSGDLEQEYFADGMVEEIIIGLSRSKSVFVIARQSTGTYKGKVVDIKQVGRELGVRYVLEGSVRKSGSRIRIAGQLIDATTGLNLWADKFDSPLENIFELQDRVTSKVIGAITPLLQRAEIERARRKPTESLQAYDYYLRALAAFYQRTREQTTEALNLTEIATRLDPEFASAYALGARCYIQRKSFGWLAGTADEIAEAQRLASRAIELDPDDPSVLARAGHALAFVVGEVEEGADLVSRAISLDPNQVTARYWMGWIHLWLGEIDAGIEQFQFALRLSPLDPSIFTAHSGLAWAHFLAGRYEEATAWAAATIRRQPNFLAGHRIMMACHAMSGRTEEAQQSCMLALQFDPSLRVSRIKEIVPLRRVQDIQRLSQAFRIAGLPE